MAARRAFSNQPGRYDRTRVESVQRLEAAVKALRLPLIRERKVGVLINAIEVQVEDGGDNPNVNRLLLEAMRAAIRHQVDERAARVAIQAIAAFQQEEDHRWRQIEAGTLPPIVLAPDEQLDELMQQGYDLLASRQTVAACRAWLTAWELVKQLAGRAVTTLDEFDTRWPLTQSVFNWSQDVEMELGNAGNDDATFHEARLRYAREFLAQFPDEDSDYQVNFRRAEGEALWQLGRQAEAEVVYGALVERLPDQAWGYIGWADQFWLFLGPASEESLSRAEAILQRALAREQLNDRAEVFERLASLYERWGKPKQQAAATKDAKQARRAARRTPASRPAPALSAPSAPAGVPPTSVRKLGRNAPCWCGSGKKYKQCHLQAAAAAR